VNYSIIEGCIRQSTNNPIMTAREELEKEIVLRKNALTFCKQDELKHILKDNLIKIQQELIELIKKEEDKKPDGVQ
tara:strand:- start:187 stop:414 length:228 start_codon:yes stop_codon:yes gene_type:complete